MDNPTPQAGPSKKTWYIIGGIAALLIVGSFVRGMIGSPASLMGEQMMEKAIEDASGGKADVDMNSDGTMNVQTSEGSFTTGKTKPANWPSDVPSYPGATVQYSGTANMNDGKNGSMMMLMTKDDITKVTAFYATELTTNGWKIAGTMQTGQGQVLAATKGDRNMSATIAGSENGTLITLGVEAEAQ